MLIDKLRTFFEILSFNIKTELDSKRTQETTRPLIWAQNLRRSIQTRLITDLSLLNGGMLLICRTPYDVINGIATRRSEILEVWLIINARPRRHEHRRLHGVPAASRRAVGSVVVHEDGVRAGVAAEATEDERLVVGLRKAR